MPANRVPPAVTSNVLDSYRGLRALAEPYTKLSVSVHDCLLELVGVYKIVACIYCMLL